MEINDTNTKLSSDRHCRSELKLHVVGEKEVNDNPVIHRLAWIPSIQNKSNNEGNQQEPLDFGVAGTVALFYNNVVSALCYVNIETFIAKKLDATFLCCPGSKPRI